MIGIDFVTVTLATGNDNDFDISKFRCGKGLKWSRSRPSVPRLTSIFLNIKLKKNVASRIFLNSRDRHLAISHNTQFHEFIPSTPLHFAAFVCDFCPFILLLLPFFFPFFFSFKIVIDR